MNLETAAYIAQQPEAIRSCIATICRDIDLDSVRNPKTVFQYARQRNFICGLGELNLRLHEIAHIAEVSKDYAREVLEARRQYGQRVRTQSWS